MVSILSEEDSNQIALPNGTVATTALVDVNLVTYNHEKFIARAIESVLAQKTDFRYRLIIGDDCSTDNTQAIIRKYAKQYPDRIQPLISPEHRGITHRERVGVQALKLNNAKYVALLDGDDYWTDTRKLQMQVDFLEAHPDYALCFHNAEIVRPEGASGPDTFSPADQKETSTLEDLLRGNFIFTGSVMFRGGLFKELPEWFPANIGDWPLHILNAQYGKIKYFNQVMAAYRLHEGSVWSSLALEQQLSHMIKFLEVIDARLDFKYHRACVAGAGELKQSCAYIFLGKFHTEARSGRLIQAGPLLLKAVKHDPWRFADPRQLVYIIKSFFIWVIRKSYMTNS